MSFEANHGQTDPEVKFLSHGFGYTLFLADNEVVLLLRASKSRIKNRKSDGKTERLEALNSETEAGGASLIPMPAGFRKEKAAELRDHAAHQGRKRIAISDSETSSVLRLELLGANPAPQVTALKELPGKSHYFIGNDPRKWRANVPNYAKVKYKAVYPGVDLVFYGNQRQLEYDFVLAPGADPKNILLGTQGIARTVRGAPLRIDPNGDLVAKADDAEVRFLKPVAYQIVDEGFYGPAEGQEDRTGAPSRNSGSKHLVDARYALKRGRQIGFELGPYDSTKPLVIDPVLSYSSYLGGSSFDYGNGIAVDSTGSAYVTGYTNSLDFPRANPLQGTIGGGACGPDQPQFPCFDVFVTKINPAGSALVYSKYLGGSREDFGTRIAVDSSGSAYVTGYTSSTNFPVVSALQAAYGGGSCGNPITPFPCFDAFVAKLKPDGSALLYSTYLGGVADDYGFGIAVDSSGSAYVTGFTSSPNFPTTPGAFMARSAGGAYDAFVAKINPVGSSLIYSTYLGGNRDDFGRGIAVDPSGNTFVAGYTNSSNFPTLNAYQSNYRGGTCGAPPNTVPCSEAFITKLNPAGSGLTYSTYLGGSSGDAAYALALDASGSAYVTGYTVSRDFPITTGSGHPTGSAYDVYVTKLHPTGSALVYSTHLGALQSEVAYGIAVNYLGKAYVTGYAYGDGFPTVNPLQRLNAGFFDAFVTQVSAAGSILLFSTYLGGSGDEEGHDIALDISGNAYVTGSTFSTNFPTTPGAFQRAFGDGSFNAFVAKISGLTSASATVSSTSLSFADQGVDTTSAAQRVTLGNIGDGTLTVASINITGDFAERHDCGSPAQVVPGSNCALDVTFTPSELGPRTGTLTVTDNAPGGPRVVSLSGRGVPSPRITLSSRSLTFAPRPVASTSAAQTVTVTNSGAAVLNIASLAASGDFAQTNDCDAPVPVGSACAIQVTFTPAAVGSSVGAIAIRDNAPGSPQVVPLIGAGSDFSLSASPASAVIAAGQAATFTLTLSPLSGFHETLSLTCVGAPPAGSCTVSPASVDLDGTSPSTALLTVGTTARAQPWPPMGMKTPQADMRGQRTVLLLLVLLFLAMSVQLLRQAVVRWCAALPSMILLIVLVSAGMAACGGGGGPRKPGTPASDYTLVVTGTLTGQAIPPGGLSHTTSVIVSVN